MSATRKSRRHPRVEVEWVDSTSLRGWTDRETLERKPVDLDCVSVGFLVSQSKDRVVVSACATSDYESFNSPMTIPRSAIRRMRRL